MDQYKVLDNLRIDFMEKVLKNKAISTAEAFKLLKYETGIDPTFKGEKLTNDQKKAKITEGINQMREKGIYDTRSMNFFQNAIPDYLKDASYNLPIFPNKDVRIDPTKGTIQDRINSFTKKRTSADEIIEQNYRHYEKVDENGNRFQFSERQDLGISPEERAKKEQIMMNLTKQYINGDGNSAMREPMKTQSPTIHCDSLISIGTVTGAELNDIEKFKDMLTQALIELQKDTELA